MPRALHWFRNDLRLHDNPALFAAAEWAEQDVVCCYLLTPGQWKVHDLASIKIDFLLKNLVQLEASLATKGIPLLVSQIDDFAATPKTLLALAKENQCQRLFFNEEYAVNERRRDHEVVDLFKQAGVGPKVYRDQSILPVGSIRTQKDSPFTVFSPFKRRWWQVFDASGELHLWPALRGKSTKLAAEKRPRIEQSASLPRLKDSSEFPAGETAAHCQLQSFIASRVEDYKGHRDFPAIAGTSKLSPYLAQGVLSGRQCLWAALQALPQATSRTGLESWINELIWRDFYINIVYDFPRVSMHRAFRSETEALEWRASDQDFNAWQTANTGIPLVDAAMRQLNSTGWMHNRLRMVTAMFLSKNLLLDWRRGERYFMRNLVDGYLPANNGGWQWSASTGTDAAPYFRIFNPIAQSEKFDPHGEFIRQWVPELAKLPDKKIHQPLSSPVTGIDYPPPIVDLKQSRQRAIDRFQKLKSRP